MSALRIGSAWCAPSLGGQAPLEILVELTDDGFAMFTTAVGGTFGCRAADVPPKRVPASPEIIEAGIAEAARTIARLEQRAAMVRHALDLLQSTDGGRVVE